MLARDRIFGPSSEDVWSINKFLKNQSGLIYMPKTVYIPFDPIMSLVKMYSKEVPAVQRILYRDIPKIFIIEWKK